MTARNKLWHNDTWLAFTCDQAVLNSVPVSKNFVPLWFPSSSLTAQGVPFKTGKLWIPQPTVLSNSWKLTCFAVHDKSPSPLATIKQLIFIRNSQKLLSVTVGYYCPRFPSLDHKNSISPIDRTRRIELQRKPCRTCPTLGSWNILEHQIELNFSADHAMQSSRSPSNNRQQRIQFQRSSFLHVFGLRVFFFSF